MATAEAEKAVERDASRLDELIAEQEAIFIANRPRAAEIQRRAERHLAGGVTSSWQVARPQPVWIERGEGSKVWDVDGHELVDLHNGYGVMAVGHAHPKIVEAVRRRVSEGTHFAQPTLDSIVVAENLAERFGLPLWRFGNSGTEATMDAIHLMRAATGRSKIIKVEGTYHGHHDSVQVSVYQEGDELGPNDRPFSAPASSGIPIEIIELTRVVPFNDLDALERIFVENEGQIAGMIMEAVMMNCGIVLSTAPGYLEGVRRITRDHGALLAFDEVKTGLTIHPGGATKAFGVTPDLVCLAKAMGGGVPCGAIGGTEEVMSIITRGEYDQVGTFNGNPLTMAAARATLTEVLTPAAYEHFARLRTFMVDGCREIIDRYELPAYVEAIGAKGCITFSPTTVTDYRDYVAIDGRYSHALWLFQHNGGVFLPPWGKAEQWMLSVQHTEDDAGLFVGNVATFARALRGSGH
jgi:glutamate-1-semialdehyde 2,1-aminomutase